MMGVLWEWQKGKNEMSWSHALIPATWTLTEIVTSALQMVSREGLGE